LGDGKCENCAECVSNGEYQSCHACVKSTHKMTMAMDGYCDGDGLDNCLVQKTLGDGTNVCLACEQGYGIYQSEGTSSGPADYTSTNADFKCHKLTDEKAISGVFYYDTTSSTRVEETASITCMLGYQATNIGTAAPSCVPESSNPGLNFHIKDCILYYPYGCAKCNGTLSVFPSFDNNPSNAWATVPYSASTCQKAPGNTMAAARESLIDDYDLSTTAYFDGRFTSVYRNKWSTGCNYQIGATVKEIKLNGYSSGNGNWVQCTAPDYGTVGDSFKGLFALSSLFVALIFMII